MTNSVSLVIPYYEARFGCRIPGRLCVERKIQSGHLKVPFVADVMALFFHAHCLHTFLLFTLENSPKNASVRLNILLIWEGVSVSMFRDLCSLNYVMSHKVTRLVPTPCLMLHHRYR